MIPLIKPYFDSDEIEEITKTLEFGWVSQGPKVEEFEEAIAKYLNVKYAIAVANCTSALHLALLSVGIKEDDWVLVSDFTFPATGHTVLYCRAKPIFVDVDLGTFNMNPIDALGKLHTKVKAIIPVHLCGSPVDMDAVMTIAESYDLKVIEDAAQALGAKYKNKYVGTIGDIGCFSLHARKSITTGEGGIVVTNNDYFASKIRSLSGFGVSTGWERYKSGNFIMPSFNYIGYNYKMSDITAAIGIAQLRKLDSIIERKQELTTYLDDKLSSIDGINPQRGIDDIRHAHSNYMVRIDDRINRNKLILQLKERGIQTQIGEYASHIQPVYNSDIKCPNSLKLHNQSLSLPLYYSLSEKEIDTITKNLMKIL